MPLLIGPSLPAGTLRAGGQPHIEVDDELVLRPWRESDATTVRAAFRCRDIQQWHVRRMAPVAEAVDWITDPWTCMSGQPSTCRTEPRTVPSTGNPSLPATRHGRLRSDGDRSGH